MAKNVGQWINNSKCKVQRNQNDTALNQEKVKLRFGHELVISCITCSNKITKNEPTIGPASEYNDARWFELKLASHCG